MRESHSSAKEVYIALGSNLGESIQIIQCAIKRLQTLSTTPLVSSSFWETSPVDCPPGSPLFINAVVRITTNATPETLLSQLQKIEHESGRTTCKQRNEPRFLDLDMIAFGQEKIQQSDLVVPHPRAHLRRFVLEPLCEIAPDFVLPGQKKSVRELLERLETSETIRRLPI